MNLRTLLLSILSGVLFGFFNAESVAAGRSYEPTLESLSQHEIPDWYSDAKFGIFVTWGLYSIPVRGTEWYLTQMSPKSRFGRNLGGPPYTAAPGGLEESVFQANIRQEVNAYHVREFGADFAYDDFIPRFRAERFDPKAWAKLFQRSGARYVVFTAKHGDEFALWDTKYTERNSVRMGPRRDLVADLTEAVRAEGLKMGLYHPTTYSFWDERFPGPDWVSYMNDSIKELIDKFQPSILWGDVTVGSVRDEKGMPYDADHWNSKEMIAYFYNHSEDPAEVLTNERWGLERSVRFNAKRSLSNSVWAHRESDYQVNGDEVSYLGDTWTPERRNVTEILNAPWETADSMDPNSWGYSEDTPISEHMTANEIVDYLADIVSKGGNLLLNVGPRSDGTIPEFIQHRLRDVGEWLDVNGEAIYGTLPWNTFGEGPTTEERGSWGRKRGEYEYVAGDVRYTRKGETVFAILLEWPGRSLALNSFQHPERIEGISLLGSEQSLPWEVVDEGIRIELPQTPASAYATVLRIRREPGAGVGYDFRLEPVPLTATLSAEDYFIWGGSMVQGEDGRCHLFYSRWEKEKGFRAWLTHSVIAHAVADDPLGPYEFVDIALPDRGAEYWDGLNTHNPTVKKFGDKYYLYYTGTTGDERVVRDRGYNWLNRNNQRIGVAVAEDPNGPWMRFDEPLIETSEDPEAWDALMVANPSVTEGPDGVYLMTYKCVAKQRKLPAGGPVTHMVATAESPTGPFIKHPDPVFTAEGDDFPAEDPFVWYGRDRYWAILNNHGAFAGEDVPLVLFQSKDGIRWELADNPVVSRLRIDWANGESQRLHSLERPQIWFDEAGQPAILFAAATEDRKTHSFNVHIPIQIEPSKTP